MRQPCIFENNVKNEQPDSIKEARYTLGELNKFTDTELLSGIDQFIDYWSQTNHYKSDSIDELNPSPRRDEPGDSN